MKKTILKLFYVCVIVVTTIGVSSCGRQKFHIEGNITDAKDSTLYFENVGLNGPVVLDSVKLAEDGSFSFSGNKTNAPEFYRLRIAGQCINLSIDSTETVTVKASYPTMPTKYTVSGSYNCSKIKELALMQIDLTNKATALNNNSQLGGLAQDSIAKLVEAYKSKVKHDYIFKEPNKAYAYYALFQTLGNSLIFNPRNNKDDIKVFAAVATSWDTYYPKAMRGKNLHNIAIEGMKNTRIVEAQNNQKIDASKVTVSGVIDIPLYDNNGHLRHLTDLKGKVVMLDFHVFATKESTQRIMALRSIYNKYHNKGFEIYQVSLDQDEHFWKVNTAELPWISVRDADGMDSRYLTTYNIQNLPAFFLIDKNNSLVKRDSQIKNLDEEIKKLL
ncbi:MAG TPA: TlpA disulfide reductase family protein [Xylanibacter oryzae]|uniref:TlpA disulfide reductase family protein n=1 Tax=Xylanibacter oryzae TaxID=185293 RepID=UPI0004B0F144|nr:TlpA disulfide reductase family protein [Xylanibacter oryzae]HRN16306.1 TlpA disulfide reductase family protein [Xylanibacter oryzae]